MEMVNAETFAKFKGVKARTVAAWFEKGYLPHAKQDETTKVYSIPNDTPRPYKGNANVNRITSLIPKLLDAADLQQAVFPGTFPKMEQGAVERTIENLENNKFIRIQTTSTGDHFLELTQEGTAFKGSPAANKSKVIEMLGKGLSYGKDVLSIASTIGVIS